MRLWFEEDFCNWYVIANVLFRDAFHMSAPLCEAYLPRGRRNSLTIPSNVVECIQLSRQGLS